MKYEYGCFISYRHFDKVTELAKKMTQSIQEELDYHGKGLKVFFDADRIKHGDNFNVLIPGSLCKSLIMVVLYVPDYFSAEKPYCTREFVAFLEHEQQRLNEIKNKYPKLDPATHLQVFPILLRKPKHINLPDELTKDRDFADWSMEFGNVNQFHKTNKYRKVIKQIAEKILDFSVLQLSDSVGKCPQNAMLPDTKHKLVKKLLKPQKPNFPG